MGILIRSNMVKSNIAICMSDKQNEGKKEKTEENEKAKMRKKINKE